MNNVIRVIFKPIKFTETSESTSIDMFSSDLMSRSEYKDILVQSGCSEFEVAYELKQMKHLLT